MKYNTYNNMMSFLRKLHLNLVKNITVFLTSREICFPDIRQVKSPHFFNRLLKYFCVFYIN